MFKMQIQWQRKGEWIDCVYPPCDYGTALIRCNDYQKRNMEHRYRIISAPFAHLDTPLAEAYGG